MRTSIPENTPLGQNVSYIYQNIYPHSGNSISSNLIQFISTFSLSLSQASDEKRRGSTVEPSQRLAFKYSTSSLKRKDSRPKPAYFDNWNILGRDRNSKNGSWDTSRQQVSKHNHSLLYAYPKPLWYGEMRRRLQTLVNR